MNFVDTSAWFSAYVPTDPRHRQTQTSLATGERLLTTDYILDETLTLLKSRGHADRALKFGPRILDGRTAKLEYIQPVDIQQAWIVFSRYRDKAWSFTDCTSFVVMKRLAITTAISLDEHFRQMPGITVVEI